MRVGFISDIHGNLPALNAVLECLEREELDRIICLGDVCFGPQAHECLQLVAELGCPVVLGNWDSWSVDGFPPADDPVGIMLNEIGAWWAALLTDDDRAFVRTFKSTLAVPLDGGLEMLCFHGSPQSFSDRIFAGTPDAELAGILAGSDASILVGGHTHLQMLRRFGPSVIVNPGSVGQPFTQWWPRQVHVAHWAEYAVVDTTDERVGTEFRRVPYDLDRLLELLAASGMPHARWWIDSWNPPA